jgi:hypothetical protein
MNFFRQFTLAIFIRLANSNIIIITELLIKIFIFFLFIISNIFNIFIKFYFLFYLIAIYFCCLCYWFIFVYFYHLLRDHYITFRITLWLDVRWYGKFCWFFRCLLFCGF